MCQGARLQHAALAECRIAIDSAHFVEVVVGEIARRMGQHGGHEHEDKVCPAHLALGVGEHRGGDHRDRRRRERPEPNRPKPGGDRRDARIRSPPRHREALQRAQRRRQGESEESRQHEANEHLPNPQRLVAAPDHRTKTAVRVDELGPDDDDQRKTEGESQAGEDRRHRARQGDGQEQRSPIGAQVPGDVLERTVELQHSAHRAERDEKEDREGDGDQLGRFAGAERDDHQWQHRDLRDRIDHRGERHEEHPDGPEQTHREAQRDAGNGTDQEAHQDPEDRNPHITEQVILPDHRPGRVPERAGSRPEAGVDPAGSG